MPDMIQIDVIYPNPPHRDRHQHYEVEDTESGRNLIADEVAHAIEKGAKQIRLEKPAESEDIRDWNREITRVVQVGPLVDYVCLPGHCENPTPHFHGKGCAGICHKQYGPEHGQHLQVGYATLDNSVRSSAKGAVMVGPPGSPVPLSASQISASQISASQISAQDLQGATVTVTRDEPVTITLANGAMVYDDLATLQRVITYPDGATMRIGR